MRGLKLVISTFIVIFIFTISCYSALADTGPYGPKGGDTHNPFGPSSSLFSMNPENLEGLPGGIVNFVQTTDTTYALQLDSWGCSSYENMGCTYLPDNGASFQSDIIPGTSSTQYLSIDQTNPSCTALCTMPVSSPGNLQTLLADWQMYECGNADLVGQTFAIIEDGSDGATNMISSPDVMIFDYYSTGPLTPFVFLNYVIPCNENTEAHIINMNTLTVPLDQISFQPYDSDCNPGLASTYEYDLNPGQKIISTDCQSNIGGTLVVTSPVPLGITIREETANGLALYNIYGAEDPADVFDSESWMTAPPGGYSADVYLINPNDVPVSATLELYKNKIHEGLYAVDIGPYCAKKIETGNLDEISPTLFKAVFHTQGIPHTEIPGNAVLMITGTGSGGMSVQNSNAGYAALESMPVFIKLGPPIDEGHVDFYSPAFFDECSLSGGMSTLSESRGVSAADIGGYLVTKTSYQIPTDQNNGNKLFVTEKIYGFPGDSPAFTSSKNDYDAKVPFIPFFGPSYEIGPLRIEPFSSMILSPESLGIHDDSVIQDIIIIDDWGYEGCGSAILSTEVLPEYVMSEEGQYTVADVLSVTESSLNGEQTDVELLWKPPYNVFNVGDPCEGVVCEDYNPCTDDYCDYGECIFTPNSDSCELDDNLCTQEVCMGGECIAISYTICPPLQTCNPLTGICEGGIMIDNVQKESEYETPEEEAKSYGITGQVTNVKPEKSNFLLGIIILAIVVGIAFAVKTYKPKRVKK